jgi:hypothetical protein
VIRLFRVFIPVGALTLLLTDILIVLGCFLGAAYAFLEVDLDFFIRHENGLLRVGIAVGTLVYAAYLQDLTTVRLTGFGPLTTHVVSMV